ncbi:hypothetical protein F5884DRAFT_221152 [Xylogone sp. PMI_703]|nr:hypothetical protein F5884DRAFT_221152 [Xylogone sp. PMI_703]
MERKRKLPARGARGEPAHATKKRATPEKHTAPTPPPAPVEEPLPTSIVAGKPLPTVNVPQPDNLSSREYQSISESGVLAESLNRSRQKWISEGLFEKYWTKPSKKKSGAELMNNPAKESMTKLGTCTITVEPHVFEATMFGIKDPNPRPPVQTWSQQQMLRPIIQYGPPNGMMPPPQPHPQSPYQQKNFPPAQPVQQTPPQHPRPYDTPKTTHTASPHPPPPNSTFTPASNAPPPPNQPPTPQQNHPPSANAAPPPAPAPAPAAKSTDPVIQMLAERAATDPELKALMRIVANGAASNDELKRFQSHIDDLTRILKQRQAAAAAAVQTPAKGPPPPGPGSTPAQSPHAATPTQGQAHHHHQMQSPAPNARTAPSTPGMQPPYHHPSPYSQPQPQALRSKGPLPSKPDITGIVFEFAGGNGDRYLFPKYSILEYLPQGQVIASFLIVRKGSQADSPNYDPTLDYYQPITIRLYTHQGRQLESLAKVVAPPDEVRRYMDDIMDNMTRAEYVLLAMRLPREGNPPPEEKKDEPQPKTEQLDHQVLWATTTSTPAPAKVKPAKKLLTEEEQYKSFIASVS